MLPALTIAPRSKGRWQGALCVTWITPPLRITAVDGTSATAVNTQVWIAVRSDVLVASRKKRLGLPQSLSTMLQGLSVTLCERMPVTEALTITPDATAADEGCHQLSLFDR